MKLSAPISVLKQRAKAVSRNEGVPLHQALDRIAKQEGFVAWSLLAAKTAVNEPVSTLLAQLRAGDLVLLGARPGQGKTLLSIELAIQTMRRGSQAAFFTLDFTSTDVANCFKALGEDLGAFSDRFRVDESDEICAEYILAKLASAPANTLVVIDYLQLLDQKREHSDLMRQVQLLKNFASERRLTVLCLSQIDRRYNATDRSCPGAGDVRLPNPLDLSLFDKMCFLHQSTILIA